jgi:hypothetical protein
MRKIFSLVLVLLSLYLSAEDSDTGWKAGVARAKITPDEPVWMGGYASRTHVAEGKIHDLWAKALVMEDANRKQVVLISTDLAGFPKNISDNIRNRLEKEYKLTRPQIILNSSHTHSGPVLREGLADIYPMGPGEMDKIEDYSAGLEDKIVKMVGKALNGMEPVNIFSGNGVVRFQVNRRNNFEPQLLMQSELKGPNDFAVPVLKIADRKGKIMAVAFGYACHGTVLNGYEWSGDYPGFAQLALEKLYPGATALFLQGAAGDQNPLPRRTAALAKQYGNELASAVERVLSEEMKPLSPELSFACSELELKLEGPPSEEELTEMVNDLSGYEQRWATRMLQKIKNGGPVEKVYPYPLQVWKIGEQLIFALGGEPVIEYAIKLKQLFGPDIFVYGYSNDVMGYIPSDAVLKGGGYEGETSQRAYGLPGKWTPGIEKEILQEMVNLSVKAGIPKTDELQEKVELLVNGKFPRDKEFSPLSAKHYYSGFELAHDTYNAISVAGNGKIYYVLSSQSENIGGQMYVYDPKTDKTSFVADLTDACGEKGQQTISQGKSHVRFYESNGKLYFATHIGYYEMIDGMERLPVNAPAGLGLYPGGHILSYSLSDGKFEDLAIAPDGEGIITMEMDRPRGQIYGITWPKGYLIHYDVGTGELKNLGQISANGEAGNPGSDYRVLCRSMFVDDRDGSVYFSTSEGDVYRYNSSFGAIKKVEGADLRLDYFGKYDPTRPGNMGYNWRSVAWYAPDGVAYGVHGNSGYLFRFDPREQKVEIVDRITSEPSRKSGMFDQFSYGYLGFQLSPDGETLYYLTGAPIYIDGKRVKGVDEIAMGAARGLENLHLITYNIPKNEYRDHGPVFYEEGGRPTYVNSIAVGRDGTVYTLARFERDGKIIEDLVKISNPFVVK